MQQFASPYKNILRERFGRPATITERRSLRINFPQDPDSSRPFLHRPLNLKVDRSKKRPLEPRRLSGRNSLTRRLS
jgi:hypothetical protein